MVIMYLVLREQKIYHRWQTLSRELRGLQRSNDMLRGTRGWEESAKYLQV